MPTATVPAAATKSRPSSNEAALRRRCSGAHDAFGVQLVFLQMRGAPVFPMFLYRPLVVGSGRRCQLDESTSRLDTSC